MGIGEIFNVVLINPIFNILLVFMFIFTSWGVPGSLGLSIIGLTTFFRLLFNPLYKKQAELSMSMEEIRPQLNKLQKKYKKDPQKLQQEQLKLYKEKNINPAAGCLVMLVQLPLILALYQVLLRFFEAENVEVLHKMLDNIAYVDVLKGLPIDPEFLGFNLGVAPSQFGQYGAYYLIVPVITAALQYYQIVLTMPKPAEDEDAKKDGKKDDSFQAVFQKQMKVMFPIMIGYFSYILPIGLALYWNVISLFYIYQGTQRKKLAEQKAQA